MDFVQDSTLQINVNIGGVPFPNVTWSHNGVVIVSNQRITTSNTGLTITNVQYTDAGLYRVTAQNCADTVKQEYNVRINCEYIQLVGYKYIHCYCSSTKCNIDKIP